jgi:hypothetical protein
MIIKVMHIDPWRLTVVRIDPQLQPASLGQVAAIWHVQEHGSNSVGQANRVVFTIKRGRLRG